VSGKGLAVVESMPDLSMSESDWDRTMVRAETYVQSGLLPTSIKTPQQAIVIIETGRELGLPPMLALRSIHVINGRPTLSADLMASLVQREIDRHKDGELRVLPPTAEECSVNYRRWGWGEGHSYTYTIQDAQRAGLATGDTWKKHPAAMLRARATAAVCRMAFPDVVAGLYAVEELEEWTPTIVETRAEAPVSDVPRIDVVEARVRGIPVSDDDQTIDAEYAEYVDQDTGEITGQQALPDTEPVNGIEMITQAQADRISVLGKLLWPPPEHSDERRRNHLRAVAGEITGITNPKLLSEYRARDLLVHLEAMVEQKGLRVTA
jgi:RecT family